MTDITSVCASNPVTDVFVETNGVAINAICFILANNQIVRAEAHGDPNTTSWFHIFCSEDDPEFMGETDELTLIIKEACVDKIITSIEIDEDDGDDVLSILEEYDTVEDQLMRIMFEDGTNFEFVLRNSSDDEDNNGWFELTIC